MAASVRNLLANPLSRALAKLLPYLHLLLISLVCILVLGSQWIFIGRQLSQRASFWDYCHVYLGLLCAVLAVVFAVHVCSKGKWRQLLPWLCLPAFLWQKSRVFVSRSNLNARSMSQRTYEMDVIEDLQAQDMSDEAHFPLQQLWQDVSGLARGRMPIAGGAGLFSVVEGITLLLLLLSAFSGVVWFWEQGTADALVWRDYHHSVTSGFVAMVVLHMVLALSHLLAFIRQ